MNMRWIKPMLTALAGLFMLHTVAWAQPAPNGGFEDWKPAPAKLQQAINCEQVPADWILAPEPAGKQYTVRADAGIKHGGNSALCLANTASNGSMAITQRIDVEPETRYKIRLWVRGEKIDAFSPKGIVILAVASSETNKADTNKWAGALRPVYMNPSPNNGSFEWKEVIGVVDSPAGARSISLTIMLSGAGALWLDDVELIPVEKYMQVESY